MSCLHVRVPMLCALVVAGCAPMRQPGALSPVGARVTNEVITEDGRTLDAWTRRVALLQQAGAPATPTRAYVVARAAAWLGYARDVYARDPRDDSADAALAETRRLVVALEQGSIPEVGELPVRVDVPARPDLWQVLDRARAAATSSGAAATAPAAMADAEVALVRASRLAAGAPSLALTSSLDHPMTAADRACELQLQVGRAERLIAELHVADEQARTVELQAMPLRAAPALPLAVAPLRRRGVERIVHFAVNSSDLALASRMTLGDVIVMLRSHPKVNVVIRGFTDPRGSVAHNRDLAVHRAENVRHFLDAAALDLGRVTMEGIGTDSASTSHASIDAFARDRRVTLAFTGPDGEALSESELEALSVNLEKDLQLEREGGGSRAMRLRTRRGSAR